MEEFIISKQDVEYAKIENKMPNSIMKKNEKANTVDPDEIARYEPYHLDLHCLQSCRFKKVKDKRYFVTYQILFSFFFQNLNCGPGYRCETIRSTCGYPPCPYFPTCVREYILHLSVFLFIFVLITKLLIRNDHIHILYCFLVINRAVTRGKVSSG